MKSTITFFLIVTSLLAINLPANAQNFGDALVVSPEGVGGHADNVVHVLDTATFQVIDSLTASVSGFTINGFTGMTINPLTGEIYVMYKVSGGTRLGKMNPFTGVITDIGDPGTKFACIAFDDQCNLYGISGNVFNNPESLYLINPDNANTTLIKDLAHNIIDNDGEACAFNWDDSKLYRMSGWGYGNVIFQSIDPADTFKVTDIPVTNDTPNNATFLIYIGDDTFIFFDVDNDNPYQMNFISTTGVVDTALLRYSFPVKGVAVIEPALEITNNGDNSFCEGETTLLTSAPSAFSYQWYNNGQIIAGATSQNYQVDESGSYNCFVSYGGCGSDSALIPIVVTVNPTPLVLVSPTTGNLATVGAKVTLTSSAASSFQWFKDGLALIGSTSMTYDATEAGTYTVLASDVNGCSDTASAVITSTIGIAETDVVFNHILLPNPTSGQALLTLELKHSSNIDISVFDAIGKKVLNIVEGEFNNGQHRFEFNLNDLQSGIYFYQIQAGNDVFSERIVILK